MEEIVVNIIHLPNDPKYPHREERERSVIEQMEMEGCEYRFWDGVTGKIKKENISKAHKQIVRWAKYANLPYIIIAEDDLRWYGSGAWKYFLDNMPEDFDLYLSSYYSGKADENNRITMFSGLTLYAVKNSFYDRFLAVPENMHIDSALSMIGGKFIVSPLFCTFQQPGYSEQRKTIVDHSAKHKGKPIFS